MSEHKSKVLFWGSGSIGSLFGGLLSLSSELQITLLGRDPHIETIKQNGLLIKKRSQKNLRIPALNGYSVLPKQTSPFDVIFVTCKARDNIDSA